MSGGDRRSSSAPGYGGWTSVPRMRIRAIVTNGGPERLTIEHTPPSPPFVRGGVRGARAGARASSRQRAASPPYEGGVGGGGRIGCRVHTTQALAVLTCIMLAPAGLRAE